MLSLFTCAGTLAARKLAIQQAAEVHVQVGVDGAGPPEAQQPRQEEAQQQGPHAEAQPAPEPELQKEPGEDAMDDDQVDAPGPDLLETTAGTREYLRPSEWRRAKNKVARKLVCCRPCISLMLLYLHVQHLLDM